MNDRGCQTIRDALSVAIFIETAMSIHLLNACSCFHTQWQS